MPDNSEGTEIVAPPAPEPEPMIIQSRTHDEDLAGSVAEGGVGYEHLDLPTSYDRIEHDVIPEEAAAAIRELIRTELVKFSGALIGTTPTGDSGHMFKHFLGDVARHLGDHLAPPDVDPEPAQPVEETDDVAQ